MLLRVAVNNSGVWAQASGDRPVYRGRRLSARFENRGMMGRLPAIFFGHGTPMIAMLENETTRTWRRAFEEIARPRAILCISAHWVTRGIGLTAQDRPPTIHDFGNFPRAMHEMEYPAPGDPALVARVRELLDPLPATPTDRWGLDHGCWTVLMKIFPHADVPVVQLSMDAGMSPDEHFALGRKLRPLRDEGILVMGSGNIVHDLGGVVRREGVAPHPYAAKFAHAIHRAIAANDASTVLDYEGLGADAARSVPSPDHFWPLLYVLGTRYPDDQPVFLNNFIEFGSIDMTTVMLRPALAA